MAAQRALCVREQRAAGKHRNVLPPPLRQIFLLAGVRPRVSLVEEVYHPKLNCKSDFHLAQYLYAPYAPLLSCSSLYRTYSVHTTDFYYSWLNIIVIFPFHTVSFESFLEARRGETYRTWRDKSKNESQVLEMVIFLRFRVYA